jgi:NHL repeat
MTNCVASAVLLTALVAASSTLSVSASRDPVSQRSRGCALTTLPRLIECMRSSGLAERSHDRTWVTDAGRKSLIYASEPFGEAVSISAIGPKGLTPVGNLTFSGFLPVGLAVDASQNLYVALIPTQSQNGQVDVFPRGAKQPSKVYTDGLTQPEDVAVDSGGTVYVANFSNTSGDCTIVEYAKGSMKPTRVITGIPGCLDAVAVDSSRNLYATFVYYPASGGVVSDVLKYAPGSNKGVRLNLTAPGGNLFWNVAVDDKGDIVVANVQEVGTVNQILVFPRGSRRPAHAVQYGFGWYPLYFALQGTRFYTLAYMVNEFPPGAIPYGEPAVFDYPSGRERFVESPKLLNPGYYFGYAVSP